MFRTHGRLLYLTLATLLVALITALPKSTEIVKTGSGKIRGIIVTSPSGRQVDAFLGIPYTKPPLGNLRFRPPEAVEPWPEVKSVTEQPPSCIQKPYPFSEVHPGIARISPSPDISEDCLKLNIWVPHKKPPKTSVLVFIYGGGFARGGTSTAVYDGTILSAEEELIVVTFNYRLASFGFLYFDHPDAPGNMGLLDQVMALTWLKENVQFFGGDPDSVTIYGHSAGSSSVGYHLLSELSKNLFTRAIMQSGAPHDMWAYSTQETATHFGIELAQNAGCPYDKNNVSTTIDCLKHVEASEIIYNEPTRLYDYVYNFVPVVDNYFMKASPSELVKKGSVKKVDLITGTVKDEATLFLSSFLPLVFPLKDKFSFTFQDAKFVTSSLVGLSQIAMEVMFLTYSNPSMNVNDFSNLLDMTKKVGGDAAFVCSLLDFEDAVMKVGGSVHKYYFMHRSSNSKWPEWFGTVHGEDFRYAFGEPLVKMFNYTTAEVELSKRIMKYWANFARTGDPNSPAEDLITWPRLSEEHREYLIMAPNSTATARNFRAKTCSFWREYLPRIETELGPKLSQSMDKEALNQRG